MSADLALAYSGGRSKLRLILTANAPTNDECGRAVRTSQLSSTSLPPTRAVRSRTKRCPRRQARNIAPSIYLIRVISERAGS
jgi:hypothetical protein